MKIRTKHHMLLFDTSTFGEFLWLPSCECGWTGQEHDTRDAAVAEWDMHFGASLKG